VFQPSSLGSLILISPKRPQSISSNLPFKIAYGEQYVDLHRDRPPTDMLH